MKIKILNYNIFYGFHNPESRQFEKKRLEHAKEIIKDENPDVFVITEACFGGDYPKDKHIDYKKEFGYKYGQFAPWSAEWGNFILSKFPFTSELLPFGERTALRTHITINNMLIHLDIIHPSPFITEQQKLQAIEKLVSTSQKPYFLVGDFNALSDEDEYSRERLIKGFREFTNEAEKKVDSLLERKLIPFLKRQELIDAMPKTKRTFTIPTDSCSLTKNSAIRIDYFFVSKDVKIIDAYTVKNEHSEKASDHYPIAGIFEIK